MRARPNIEVRIEELVLHGFAAGDRDAIAHALEVELTRQLSSSGTPRTLARSSHLGRVDAGAFQVAAPVEPRAVGAQTGGAIASALHGAKR